MKTLRGLASLGLVLALAALPAAAMAGGFAIHVNVDMPDGGKVEASIPSGLLEILKEPSPEPIPFTREELEPLVDRILMELESIKGGELVLIDFPGGRISAKVEEVGDDRPELLNFLQVRIDPSEEGRPKIQLAIPTGAFFLLNHIATRVIEEIGPELLGELDIPIAPMIFGGPGMMGGMDTPPAPQAPVEVEKGDIPERDEDADEDTLDLSGAYNHSLQGTLHPNDSMPTDVPNDLSEFPAGLFEYEDEQFDVRGVVQLKGVQLQHTDYPESVVIPVGRSFEEMYVLHSVGWASEPGTVVGHYVLHYQDESTESLDIVYGMHAADWWDIQPDEVLNLEDTEVAWRGSNPLARAYSDAENPIRLFVTEYENPRPDEEVAAIEFKSAMTDSCPFLLAVTLE